MSKEKVMDVAWCLYLAKNLQLSHLDTVNVMWYTYKVQSNKVQ